MKYPPIKRMSFLVLLALIGSGCGAATEETTSSSATADDDDVADAYSGAVEALVNSVSSTSSSGSALVKALGTSALRGRFQCADESSIDDGDPSCVAPDASVTITLTDCAVTGPEGGTATVNGSFTNTFANGGSLMCNADASVDLAAAVMGTDVDDVHTDAVHTHVIGEAGMVRTFTGPLSGLEVTVTRTGSHTATFSDPVDENADNLAESVTATMDHDMTIAGTDGVKSRTDHVFTSDAGFTSIAEDSTETVVETSSPVHAITFDADGYLESRTIVSGNLIIDNEEASIRVVMGVGDTGLELGDCGPENGTATSTVYTLNSDDTVGPEVGTGEVVFVDGTVTSATFSGEDISSSMRPKHCE